MNYRSVLFDPNEQSCFGSLYETAVRPVELLDSSSEFVAINPLTVSRADKNVVVFRNILIECDQLPLDQQAAAISKSGLPFSTQVYSGGKSYHYVVSLQEPAADRAAYDLLVQRVYSGLAAHGFIVDRSCKNPSRFTRAPGYFRHEKNSEQKLIEVRSRISPTELNNWLQLNAKPVRQRAAPSKYIGPWRQIPCGFTQNFLMFGHKPAQQSRHNALCAAACDLRDCSYSEEEVIEKLFRVPGIFEEVNGRAVTEHEIEKLVSWAFSQSQMEKV